jgi:HSP20 family molecular chaperone IbpA
MPSQRSESTRSRPPTQANQKQRTDSSERKRTRKSESTDCLIDTRLDDSEFVVVADLPGHTKTISQLESIQERTNSLSKKRALLLDG